jgi:hypothetical protein
VVAANREAAANSWWMRLAPRVGFEPSTSWLTSTFQIGNNHFAVQWRLKTGIPGRIKEKKERRGGRLTSDNQVTTSGFCGERCQARAIPTERNCYQLDSTEPNWTGGWHLRFPLALPSFHRVTGLAL